MSKSKIPADDLAPKAGGKKKLVIIVLGALTLTAAGTGGGLWLGGKWLHPADAAKEDPNRPKLVERSADKSAEKSVAGEGGETKEPPRRTGTVSVPSDTFLVDPKKYEVSYVPIDQTFTANLADGSGFVQVGLNAATYYDSRVVDNLKRQAVPIRSAILLALSSQQAQVISTPDGKMLLQRQLTNAVNEVLREHEGFGGISNVYFSNLVIQ
jgi:flagellar FliL protein